MSGKGKLWFDLPEYSVVLASVAVLGMIAVDAYAYSYSFLLIYLFVEALAPRPLLRPALNVLIVLSLTWAGFVFKGRADFFDTLEVLSIWFVLFLVIHLIRYAVILFSKKELPPTPSQKPYLILAIAGLYLAAFILDVVSHWNALWAVTEAPESLSLVLRVGLCLATAILLFMGGGWRRVGSVAAVLAYLSAFAPPNTVHWAVSIADSYLGEVILGLAAPDQRNAYVLLFFGLQLLGLLHPDPLAYFRSPLSPPVQGPIEEPPGEQELLPQPVEVFYDNNAFRLSGCPINAPTPLLLGKLNEVKVRVAIDGICAQCIPLPYPFSITRKAVEHTIMRVNANTESRVKEEMRWLWTMNGDDFRNEPQKAWNTLPGRCKFSHDQAVVLHIIALSVDMQEIAGGSAELSNSALKAWREALAAWLKAQKDEATWSHLEARAEAIRDPAFRSKQVQRLKDSHFPLHDVIELNVELAKSAITADHCRYIQYIMQHLQLVKKSDFPSAIVDQGVGEIAGALLIKLGNPFGGISVNNIDTAERAVKEMERFCEAVRNLHRELPALLDFSREICPVVHVLVTVSKDYSGEHIGRINDLFEELHRILVAITNSSYLPASARWKAMIQLKTNLQELKRLLTDTMERQKRVVSLLDRLKKSLDAYGASECADELTQARKQAQDNLETAEHHLRDVRQLLTQIP